jgi:hypothetical protein
MKKFMIAAAAAAITVVGSAAGTALNPVVCENCGAGGSSQGPCPTVVFKVTGSGKAVVNKGDYKSVEKLKIKKGALALEGELCADTGACCYNGGTFYATIKVGKKTFGLAAPVELGVWSVFGKDLEKSRNYMTSIKPGKKVTLDSALFLTSTEAVVDDDADVNLDEFALYASAFGKVEMKVTSVKKGSTAYCEKAPDQGCDPIYTPKTYNGWFVGTYPCVGEEDCFLCDCTDTDVFGGTWKAVYQSKYTTDRGAQKLAGVSISEE